MTHPAVLKNRLGTLRIVHEKLLLLSLPSSINLNNLSRHSVGNCMTNQSDVANCPLRYQLNALKQQWLCAENYEILWICLIKYVLYGRLISTHFAACSGRMGNFQEVLGINEVSSSKVINAVWKALLAEFLGNFLLNFFGCGSVIVMAFTTEHQPNFLLVALTFGLVVFVCVQVKLPLLNDSI